MSDRHIHGEWILKTGAIYICTWEKDDDKKVIRATAWETPDPSRKWNKRIAAQEVRKIKNGESEVEVAEILMHNFLIPSLPKKIGDGEYKIKV